MRRDVERNVKKLHGVLQEDTEPDVEPGAQCTHPYDCPFQAHCTRGFEILEHSIDELPRLMPPTRQKLEEQGYLSILDIPEDWSLSPTQERVRGCVVSGRPFVSRGLKAALKDVRWPLYHLDFETFMTALPRHRYTRPYQAIPFEWSCHVEQKDGSLEHRLFLSFDDEDPREAFAKTLIEAVGSQGSICVYSSYEKTQLRQLEYHLPQLGPELRAIMDRLWDLKKVVSEHFYHPDFHGSYSIKSVLPALVPELGYGDLGIREGQAAGRAYLEAIATDDAARRRELQQQLIDYCTRDTRAMVEVRRALLRASSR